MSRDLTRRAFAQLTAGGFLSAAVARPHAAALTAGDVVDRIKQRVGVPWNPKTYRDTFKLGTPDMAVSGIVSSFMSTLDVLQRAAASGANMIVTHEPTFWNDADLVTDLADDPLYRLKVNFAAKHQLVVWRFHDHWHARKPDGIFTGWVKALGWEKYATSTDQRRWVMPTTTLEAVARDVQRQLRSRSIRIVGDPKTPVTTVGRGAHSLAGNMATLPEVDAILVSEAREWDSIEYVRDVVLSGEKKGMILIAHEIGEEAGMDYCATWLREFISEVPVTFIDSGEPFWIPT